ncbi:MAG: DDE-type integrase/transposase/recombinase [Lachnospiraceae bacterium]|nr:DDE-type integrase/transposase/recombinase [Lachnospiraceae bacterium]
METNNETTKWQEREALERFRMISPLIDPDIDNPKRIQLRKAIAEENGISTRSLYRYESSFRDNEFAGLKPVPRSGVHSHKLPENFDSLLKEAIHLRLEVPERSVDQIISILELEGKAPIGRLKRSTLQRHMYKAGYGTRHLKIYADARESSSKRFCKPHRMMLVQGDIKYGPILTINGKKVQTYLSSAIDDHSRMILASQFYDNQEELIVEDTFRKVILRYGKFDACYFDNGTQYIAKQLKFSLARLGIRVRHAKVRSGKSKGKIEKFHQVVDSFIREAKLKDIESLEELNRLWNIFLEEYYSHKPHNGIKEYYESMGASVPKEGITPLQEFNRDKRALAFIDAGVVAEAFMYHEKRRVNKGACISFKGRQYETKPSLIGYEVEVSYDPISPETVTISYPGIEPFKAKPLKIGEYCDKKETLPIAMQLESPGTSRFLDALDSKHKQTKKQLTDAISFASYRKEGGSNV